MKSFNLITEDWIPVLTNDGTVREVGLREALVEAHTFREVSDESPLFIASIQSVLLAILHRCWRTQKRRERIAEWKTIWNNGQGQFTAEVIDGYFSRFPDRFDLFHPQYPFYQVADLKTKEAKSLSRLALEENNASPIFQHPSNPDWQKPSSAFAARLLITIQNYAVGFGIAADGQIGQEKFRPPRFANPLLLSGLTVWPAGETLFKTLMLNLVPHEAPTDDLPCWELEEPHRLRDIAQGQEGRRRSPLRGLCDRLTFQSRLMLLDPTEVDGETIVSRVYFTQGRSLKEELDFHPFKVYRKTKEGIKPLPLSENKAIWRNAHALLEDDRGSNPNNLSPLVFMKQRIGDPLEHHQLCKLQVVGVASKPGKAAAILIWRHDRFPLPLALLEDRNLVNDLGRANKAADDVAEEMRQRFVRVARAFLVPERDGDHKPDPDDVKSLVDKFDPRRPFWPLLENHFYHLMTNLPDDRDGAMELWNREVERNAQTCFAASLNALGDSLRAVVAAAQVSGRFSVLQADAAQTKRSAKRSAAAQKSTASTTQSLN